MHSRLFIAALLLPALAGWGDHDLAWPHSGPSPDEPVGVPFSRYVPVGTGTKSYRPVEPLPWGDVNRRVAPTPTVPKEAPSKTEPPGHDAH